MRARESSAHDAENAHPHSPSRLMSLEAGGSVREAAALNVTLEVPLMDGHREVRCAKEQEQALFSFFFFKTKSIEEQVSEAARRSLSSGNNGNLLCVPLHVDVFECLLMLESSVSHVYEQIILWLGSIITAENMCQNQPFTLPLSL